MATADWVQLETGFFGSLFLNIHTYFCTIIATASVSEQKIHIWLFLGYLNYTDGKKEKQTGFQTQL